MFYFLKKLPLIEFECKNSWKEISFVNTIAQKDEQWKLRTSAGHEIYRPPEFLQHEAVQSLQEEYSL